MRIENIEDRHGTVISRVVYDDIYGVSELFEPKIWIDFWSRDRKYYLKTALGERIPVYETDMRKLNLKMVLQDVGTTGRPLYKRFMSVNTPRRASERIPLLSISKKLNKLWKGSINVEREYEQRYEKGYRYWCPGSNN